MKRAAIYARYSTDLQHDRSIDDQIAVCRAFAERNGWHVVAVFTDRAQSGASMIGRDGVLALVEAGKRKDFDIMIAEHGDRLSRITEELDGIRRRMQFADIVIHTVNAGIIDETQAAIQGLMGALFLRELGNKVRRGLSGVVRDGRNPGGRPYGYRTVPGEPGRLLIDEGEASVIRRILTEYADGRAPRTIAGDLNREGVPPPRGTRWNASTINGNAVRGHGMIFNDIYNGRIVWNRVRMIKDPDTGRRVSRANSSLDWQTAEAPDLRIIDDELWQRARGVKLAKSKVMSHMKRAPAHLLSGLLRCGICGSGMSAHDRDKTGKVRVRCSAVRESGTCSNRRIVYLVMIERTVLAGLIDHLSNPWLIAEYVDTYNAERQRLAKTGPQEAAKLQAQRDVLNAQHERVKRAFIRGLISEDEAEAELPRIRVEQEALEDQLRMIGDLPTVITLHPAAMARFRASAADLVATLADHAQKREGGSKAVSGIRTLIETVTIHPEGPRAGFDVEVRGRLDELIRDGSKIAPRDSGGRVVAGEGHDTRPSKISKIRHLGITVNRNCTITLYYDATQFKPRLSRESVAAVSVDGDCMCAWCAPGELRQMRPGLEKVQPGFEVFQTQPLLSTAASKVPTLNAFAMLSSQTGDRAPKFRFQTETLPGIGSTCSQDLVCSLEAMHPDLRAELVA